MNPLTKSHTIERSTSYWSLGAYCTGFQRRVFVCFVLTEWKCALPFCFLRGHSPWVCFQSELWFMGDLTFMWNKSQICLGVIWGAACAVAVIKQGDPAQIYRCSLLNIRVPSEPYLQPPKLNEAALCTLKNNQGKAQMSFGFCGGWETQQVTGVRVLWKAGRSHPLILWFLFSLHFILSYRDLFSVLV